MEITSREIATIVPALECWKEELAEGEEWIPDMLCFKRERPLSLEEVDELITRLRKVLGKPRSKSDLSFLEWRLNLYVPTYIGSQKAQLTPQRDSPDFGSPEVPILVCPADGVRLVLGTHDYDDHSKPDVQIERRPHGWAIFIHPDAGDPIACLFILDGGRTFLLQERFVNDPLEIVDDIPPELDTP